MLIIPFRLELERKLTPDEQALAAQIMEQVAQQAQDHIVTYQMKIEELKAALDVCREAHRRIAVAVRADRMGEAHKIATYNSVPSPVEEEGA